jgi:hypothetical protein
MGALRQPSREARERQRWGNGILERIAAERGQPPRESARQNKELEHFQHRSLRPVRLKML